MNPKIQLLRRYAAAVARLSQCGDAMAWEHFEHLTQKMLTVLLGHEPTQRELDAALLAHPQNQPPTIEPGNN
jgi:hypothetical protein